MQNENVAKMKARVLELAQAGNPASKIAATLKAEGLKSPRGKDVTANYIHQIRIKARKAKAKPVQAKHIKAMIKAMEVDAVVRKFIAETIISASELPIPQSCRSEIISRLL